MAAVAEGKTDAGGINWINDCILSSCLGFRCVFCFTYSLETWFIITPNYVYVLFMIFLYILNSGLKSAG